MRKNVRIKKVKRIKRRVLKLIDREGELTLQALQNYLLEDNFDVDGEYSFYLEDYNIVIWDSMSVEFVDAVSELLQEQKIAMEVCDILDYDIDPEKFPVNIVYDFPDEELDEVSFLPIMLTDSVDIAELFS